MRQFPRAIAALVLSFGFSAFPIVGQAAQLDSILSNGLTIRQITTRSGMGAKNGQESTETVYFSKNRMKRTSSDGTDIMVVFGEKLVMIDNKKKTYKEMTFQELQDMVKGATSGMEHDAEAMQAMRKMMGQAGAEVKVTKLGPGEDIAGYRTERYTITGFMEWEVWAAPDLKVPASYYDAMKLNLPDNPMFDFKKMYEEFKKVDGFFLKSVMTLKIMNMNMMTSSVVTGIEKGPIPESVFAIPEGYKREGRRQ